MPRFKLTLEYDGTGLAGWQRQKSQASVQEHLEKAAQALCDSPIKMIAAGRTDAGVHAIGQVVHFDTQRSFTGYNVLHGINFYLSSLTHQIVITDACIVPDDFHARFSALSRSYRYHIVNRPARLALFRHRAWHIPEPLNAEAMQDAAQLLTGSHDFSTFRDSQCQSKSPFKTLDLMEVTASEQSITITVTARSFLHHQVRNMAGSLRLVGNGKWSNEHLLNALKACDRKAGGETAPPQGLFLTNVGY